MRVCAGIDELAAHERYAAATPDVVAAIAEGIGQFAAGEWAPLNRIGDTHGATISDGIVRLPNGFPEAYQAYVEAGWNSIPGPDGFGGQDLPFTLACCVMENLGAANMAFSLLPMLTLGAIEALKLHGSAEQQALYLPRLISGAWSVTMNLTEPQAGAMWARCKRLPRRSWTVPMLASIASMAQNIHYLGRARTRGKHHPSLPCARAECSLGLARDQSVRRTQISGESRWRHWAPK